MALSHSLALFLFSMWALVFLLLLITIFLNSDHPGGGCLTETKVKLFGHLVLLVLLFGH